MCHCCDLYVPDVAVSPSPMFLQNIFHMPLFGLSSSVLKNCAVCCYNESSDSLIKAFYLSFWLFKNLTIILFIFNVLLDPFSVFLSLTQIAIIPYDLAHQSNFNFFQFCYLNTVLLDGAW